jgi:hypothetical protein
VAFPASICSHWQGVPGLEPTHVQPRLAVGPGPVESDLRPGLPAYKNAGARPGLSRDRLSALSLPIDARSAIRIFATTLAVIEGLAPLIIREFVLRMPAALEYQSRRNSRHPSHMGHGHRSHNADSIACCAGWPFFLRMLATQLGYRPLETSSECT